MITIQRLLAYGKNYWKQLFFAMSTATLLGILTAAPSYLIKYVVDDIFVGQKAHLILPFLLIFAAVFVVKGVCMYYSQYYMNWVGNTMINSIRKELFAKVIYLPLSILKRYTTSDLQTYFLNDIKQVQAAIAATIRNGIRSVFEFIFLLGIAFYQNWQLTFFALAIAPPLIWLVQRLSDMIRFSGIDVQERMDNLGMTFQEILFGMRDIKVYGAEQFEVDRFDRRNKVFFDSSMHNAHLESLAPAVIEVGVLVGMMAAFYMGARQVFAGTITPGQLTSFFASIVFAYQPLRRALNVLAEVQNGLASADRIFKVIDETGHEQEVTTGGAITYQNSIQFNDVSFWYQANEPVLTEINCTIYKGDRIALTGPSGAGKSTLCDLLLGFISPCAGKVLIDGTDLCTIAPAAWRHNIAYVCQIPFLFNDSIRSNIIYSDTMNLNDEQKIMRAVQHAGLEQNIQEFADGYETIVGEQGNRLSGGQKQRVVIARALFAGRPLLIFDEATSALDLQSEEIIAAALDTLPTDVTVVVITHRPRLIAKMDRVFQIDTGTLREAKELSIQAPEGAII